MSQATALVRCHCIIWLWLEPLHSLQPMKCMLMLMKKAYSWACDPSNFHLVVLQGPRVLWLAGFVWTNTNVVQFSCLKGVVFSFLFFAFFFLFLFNVNWRFKMLKYLTLAFLNIKSPRTVGTMLMAACLVCVCTYDSDRWNIGCAFQLAWEAVYIIIINIRCLMTACKVCKGILLPALW